MKQRKTRNGTGRWTERRPAVELVSPYGDTPAPVREPRTFDVIAGQRPYESSYDISLGYAQDRSIHLP